MVVNDDAGCLEARGVWATIASKLAPTGDRAPLLILIFCRSELARDGR